MGLRIGHLAREHVAVQRERARRIRETGRQVLQLSARVLEGESFMNLLSVAKHFATADQALSGNVWSA
jgi:hypothetical protein